MKRSELTEFAVEEEGFKLKIRRGQNGVPVVTRNRDSNPPVLLGGSDNSLPPMSAPAPQQNLVPASPVLDDAGIAYIKSPMVGTFYRSPSPESKSFADVGTKVTETSPVCIIEAMKIMNELESEYDGVVREVNVTDAHAVEYGQVLFRLDPTG